MINGSSHWVLRTYIRSNAVLRVGGLGVGHRRALSTALTESLNVHLRLTRQFLHFSFEGEGFHTRFGLIIGWDN